MEAERMHQYGIFAEEDRLEKLSKLGDCLERLSFINWESFRSTLNAVLVKPKKTNGGRPAYDYVLMFKILILQRLFNLSYDQAEYQINDRMSFMRFLGLGLGDPVPDAKTIWLFHETLVKAQIIEDLFQEFTCWLDCEGVITHKGTIVDATFVDAPRQRNTRDENKAIKAGEVPAEWKQPNQAHKLSQKDTDARWAVKNKETHFGYKDHTKVDADSKIITEYSVTSANVHDSNEFVDFINETDQTVYADSAYAGRELKESLPSTIEYCVHEKGYRGHPLTDEQKQSNREKSKTRARIEHVYGFMTGSMHGITIRCIGMARAAFNIGLTNLTYNLCRYCFIKHREQVMG